MYKKILVPVDSSKTSARGLEEAIKLAKSEGARLFLLHVVDEFIAVQDAMGAGFYAEEMFAGLDVSGVSGHYPQVPREVDDFKQPGDLYRLQAPDAQQRLVDNIADSLAQVSRVDIIERSVGHFSKADAEFGRRVAEGIQSRRGAVAR